MNTIEAIYDDGVFRPLDPVNLPAHERVRITFESMGPETTAESRQSALRRFRELCLGSGFRSTGPYPTREELHERR